MGTGWKSRHILHQKCEDINKFKFHQLLNNTSTLAIAIEIVIELSRRNVTMVFKTISYMYIFIPDISIAPLQVQ